MGRMGEIAAGLYAPDGIGWKDPSTSRDAGLAVRNRSETLRERILALLATFPSGLTPDEASERLNETVLAVRPRFTELSKLGKIAQTGERRQNASGMKAKVWRVA